MPTLGKAYVQVVPSARGIGSSLKKELQGETQGLGDGLAQSVFGSLKGAIGKLAIGAGIATIFKSAISEGSKLEQSIGGVETIFKSSADLVKGYAAQAYKTAGLSMNDYMENVTSFSASLIQSCSGNTKQAAEIANRAMIDMSDNANKMGTNMEDIQNAYQGFAKDNYTMLDNLKLGYGGTKQEMQRLVQDASKMTDVQKELGVTVDGSSLSFANIANAISVVQKHLGISGTTAKEAASTFSGSFAQMKASAQNLLGYMADHTDNLDIKPALTQLAQSVSTFLFGNAIPMIMKFVEAIPSAVAGLIEAAIPIIKEQAPKMILGIMDAVGQLGMWLVENGPQLAHDIWDGLISTLETLIPQMIDKGKEIITNIGKGLSEKYPELSGIFDNLLPIVESIGAGLLAWKISSTFISGISSVKTGLSTLSTLLGNNGLINGFATSISAAGGPLSSFATNIISAGGGLKGFGSALLGVAGGPIGLIVAGITAAVSAVIYFYNTNENFRDFVNKCWADIKKAAQDLCAKIGEFFGKLPAVFQQVCQNIQKWWNDLKDKTSQVWQQICTSVSNFCQNVSTTITNIFNGIRNFFITVWNAIYSFISSVVTNIRNTITTIFNAVSSFISSCFNGIRNTASNIWNGISSTISGVVNGIRNTVSSVFNALASVVSGIWNGIRNTASSIWNGISSTISGVVNGIKNSVSNVFNSVKNTVTNIWNGIKNTASSVWNGVKDAINTPMQKAKDLVKGVIDKIKGFFNFSFSWPHIPLPHFSVSPSGWKIGDLLKGSIPSLGISWYATAMDDPFLFTRPTVFGLDGRMVGAGEAGNEIMYGHANLMRDIETASRSGSKETKEVLLAILSYLRDGGLEETVIQAICEKLQIKWNDRELGRMVKAVV